MAKDIQDEINDYLMKASKPKNDFEKMLINKMTKELGTVTSAKELSLFLKIGKSSIYRGLDTGEILSFRSGKRRFILTEGVLPFLRD